MNSFKPLIWDSTRLFFDLVRAQFAAVTALFLAGTFLSFQFEDAILMLGPGEDTKRLTLSVTAGLIDLISGVILLLVLSWGVQKVRPLKGPRFLEHPFERPYISSFLAEYLRVLGQVLLWGLALIIPGIFRYAQLSFVPLITLFSKEYENDEVDALQLSAKLFKRCAKSLLLIVVLSGALQLILELAAHFRADLHALPARLTLNLASFLISVWTYSFIILLFKREMENS